MSKEDLLSRNSQRMNIAIAKLVAELVKSTLGPKGMDKLLITKEGETIITNDGVTILKESNLQHPIAKIIIEIAKTQEEEVGDGTTTAVILAGELLKRAENLLDKKIHPSIIVEAFRLAKEKSLELLDKNSKEIVFNEEFLKKVINTSITGKNIDKNKIINLLVETIIDLINLEKNNSEITNNEKIRNNINFKEKIFFFEKIGGSINDSELIEGIILDREKVHPNMPSKLENAKVLLITDGLEIKSPEFDARLNLNSSEEISRLLELEEKKLEEAVNKIVEEGINVVCCQKGIDDYAQYLLSKNNILAFRRITREDLNRLSLLTNAKIIDDIKDINKEILGEVDFIREFSNNEEKLFIFSKKNSGIKTLLIRGGSKHVIEETRRALDDAIGVINKLFIDKRAVPGAGAVELMLSKQLRDFSIRKSNKYQLIINAFAESLEVIPSILAENAGFDSLEIISLLKTKHEEEEYDTGVNLEDGGSLNAWEKGIIEPVSIKKQAIISATEVANLLLRIDDVIMAENDVNNDIKDIKE